MTEELAKLEQLVQKIEPQGRLVRAWALPGGVSARVTALVLARPDGGTRKLVVRRHGAVDLAHNPQIAADEFRLLNILQSEGLPVPAPAYVDASGALFGTPCLVVEYVEGAPDFTPAHLDDHLFQLAATLARIHGVNGAAHDLSFLPRQAERYAEKLRQHPPKLDEFIGEGRIRDALDAALPLQPRNPPVLLHGDYWSGNVLWNDGRLAAVIDWEDAALGDPLADLGNSRLEILWAFGSEAMTHFTQHYLTLNALDVTDLPYWDLYAALRPAFKLSEWAANADAESRMRERHQWFVHQAFEQLAAR